MSDIWMALALVLVIEGASYAIAPQAMQMMMRQVIDTESRILRILGLVACSLGVLWAWLLKF